MRPATRTLGAEPQHAATLARRRYVAELAVRGAEQAPSRRELVSADSAASSRVRVDPRDLERAGMLRLVRALRLHQLGAASAPAYPPPSGPLRLANMWRTSRRETQDSPGGLGHAESQSLLAICALSCLLLPAPASPFGLDKAEVDGDLLPWLFG